MRAGKFILREEEESKYTKQSTSERPRDGEIPRRDGFGPGKFLVLSSSPWRN